MKSKVYFTKEITKESLTRLYDVLGFELKGNVCVKVHSGETGNQNYLTPDLFEDIVNKVNGTVVECNTAYDGTRNTTPKHLLTLKNHKWTDYFKVDLMDAEGDTILPVDGGQVIKENYVGKNLLNYDSMLVLSHFKGHPMGGYGGALKQLSIGIASSFGKLHIHSAGSDKEEEIWTADHDKFLEAMADSAKSIVDYFKGQIVYINVMKNMSVDCDCCSDAEDPCLNDIGALISLDPVAIDKACIDLVKQSGDVGVEHFMERVNSRNGLHTIDVSEKLGVGSQDYELIIL